MLPKSLLYLQALFLPLVIDSLSFSFQQRRVIHPLGQEMRPVVGVLRQIDVVQDVVVLVRVVYEVYRLLELLLALEDLLLSLLLQLLHWQRLLQHE